MSRLDLVIFGATGFTGKQAVIHMVKFAKKYNIGAWGVAGRSESKLNALMSEVATKTGSDVSGVKIFIADVGDEKSLRDMCAQTKLVVNCCGPYRMYGEPVVKAAVENKANYVDVSGEPQFMETMQLRYDAAARDAGVFVVSACGWDSVPADMGVVFLKQHFDGQAPLLIGSFVNTDTCNLVMKLGKMYNWKTDYRSLIKACYSCLKLVCSLLTNCDSSFLFKNCNKNTFVAKNSVLKVLMLTPEINKVIVFEKDIRG